MQIKCFPDTCKEIYEFGNISRDCCFGDEIQSLTRILLCGLQSALPKSRELVFPISSYSQALPPIGTAEMLIASKNKYIYCNMTWLDQVYGDVLPGFI